MMRRDGALTFFLGLMVTCVGTLAVCCFAKAKDLAPGPVCCIHQTSSCPAFSLRAYCCPKPRELHLTAQRTWVAEHKHWQSYEPSLVKEVARFVKAQWQGINLGKMICVYQGKKVATFPIELVYGSLTLMPEAGLWQAQKGHYSNCRSLDSKVEDCPFQLPLPKKNPSLDQQLKDIRAQAQKARQLSHQNRGF